MCQHCQHACGSGAGSQRQMRTEKFSSNRPPFSRSDLLSPNPGPRHVPIVRGHTLGGGEPERRRRGASRGGGGSEPEKRRGASRRRGAGGRGGKKKEEGSEAEEEEEEEEESDILCRVLCLHCGVRRARHTDVPREDVLRCSVLRLNCNDWRARHTDVPSVDIRCRVMCRVLHLRCYARQDCYVLCFAIRCRAQCVPCCD